MRFLPEILFSLSANLDNLTIGIAYGVKGTRIGAAGNLIIASISCAGTFLSMTMGRTAALLLPAPAARLLGSGFLIVLGLYFLLGPLLAGWRKSRSGGPEARPPDPAGAVISFQEAVAVACALALNNLGMGVGASISGLSPWAAALSTLVISLATVLLGRLLGRTCLAGRLGDYAVPLSGLIILGLGAYQLLF